MIRIVLYDQLPIFRLGIHSLLVDCDDIEVAAEADDPEWLLRTLGRAEADAVVLGPAPGDPEAALLLRRVRDRRPDLPVLCVAMEGSARRGLRLLRAGAAGYLDPSSDAVDVLRALRRIAGGGRFLADPLAEHLAGLAAGRGRTRELELSEREHQVLMLLVAGHSQTEVAQVLGLSVKTVNTYRGRLFKKLGLSTHVDLMRYAAEAGLIAEAFPNLAV